MQGKLEMGKPFIRYSIILLILLGGCNSDFHTKKWAEGALKNRPGITIIRNFFDLGFAENRGMIFGILNKKMPQTPSRTFIALRIIILCALTVFIWANRMRPLFFLLPFLLFWIGALGNLIDPFKYGYVVDFMHIQAGGLLNWPFYFNLADAYITIGALLILFKETMRLFKSHKPLNGHVL
jgi:signal peptidase II